MTKKQKQNTYLRQEESWKTFKGPFNVPALRVPHLLRKQGHEQDRGGNKQYDAHLKT